MTTGPEIPQQSSNGVPPGLRGPAPSAVAVTAAKAVAEALGEHLPGMLFGAVQQALAQTLVQSVIAQMLWCHGCLTGRISWEAAHEKDLAAAGAEMGTALQAMAPDNPQRQQLSPAMFLPPALQQEMPDMATGITMYGGTLYCAACVPGADRSGSKRTLLIAQGPLSPSMMRTAA